MIMGMEHVRYEKQQTSRTVRFETEKAGKDYHQGLLRRDKVNAKC